MSLKPLMFVHPPYDFLEDERTIDFLLEGGIRDIMLGYWTIIDESKEGSSYSYPRIIAEHFGHKTVTGIPVTPCRATHALYEGIDVEETSVDCPANSFFVCPIHRREAPGLLQKFPYDSRLHSGRTWLWLRDTARFQGWRTGVCALLYMRRVSKQGRVDRFGHRPDECEEGRATKPASWLAKRTGNSIPPKPARDVRCDGLIAFRADILRYP